MDTNYQLDAKHLHERNCLRKTLDMFTLSGLGHQCSGHMYGLCSALLICLLTIKQKLKVTDEKIDVLEKHIDDMVSLLLQIYCDVLPNVINSYLSFDHRTKQENGREVDGGNKLRIIGEADASDSCWALVFWGHVLSHLITSCGCRLRIDGAMLADNSSEVVSNSKAYQEEKDRMSAEESEYYREHSDGNS